MTESSKVDVDIALQGGGSHGAFTWGVLDRLLEDDRIRIRGVSGTSAGAMNAVALVQGLCSGGPQAASLGRAVPDLTRIAARNGGTFPMIEVMSTIDGYRRARAGNVAMPEFGAYLKDAPMVLADLGDGVLTPTPKPLVDVAEYLASIQR